MLSIRTVQVTPFQQNCRILWGSSKKALIIDPGGEVDKIKNLTDKEGLVPAEIWLTHSHIDHCGGVADLLTLFPGLPLSANPLEKELRSRVEDICSMYGVPEGYMKNCPEPTRFLSGGEQISFEGEVFEVLFTPGHAPGHLCFYNASGGYVLSGDTLFKNSIGRTDLPGGDYSLLIKSIREKLLVLPSEVKVLNGHGPDTTIGEEKKSNPFLK